MKRVIDYAAIEHLEHEAVLARERVREAKAVALKAAGWTEYLYVSPHWEDGERGTRMRRVRYAPPTAVKKREIVESRFDWIAPSVAAQWERAAKRSRTKKFFRYVPSYDVSVAYEQLRRRARKACGPTSCERKPRKKT